MKLRRLFALTLVPAAAAMANGAMAATYILQAPSWGAPQNAAVTSAGGQLKFSHATGLAVATSGRADFLSSVLGSGVVTSGAADISIRQAPVRTVDAAPVESVSVSDSFFPYVQWAPQSVKAPEAWAAGYKGNGVRVAVIDGGMFATHPDLAANVDVSAARSFVASGVPGLGNCPATAWDCDTGTFWHATHVAGIIAAPINGFGVVGIAPEATIVPVKALHGGSGSFEAVIEGILYAATDGHADIINMSLGAVFQRSEPGAAELVSALNRAVNFASSRGVLVLSAAGNEALDLDHSGNYIATPAQSGNGLAVSATGPFGFAYGATNFTRFASYSNWGNSLVNVAGPGGDFAWPTNESCTLTRANGTPVTAPCWAFDLVLSTSRAGYTWAAGTSMATPAVAAVAALIKQKYPGISVGALKTRLMRATSDEGKVGNDPYYGKGYVNAWKAVTD